MRRAFYISIKVISQKAIKRLYDSQSRESSFSLTPLLWNTLNPISTYQLFEGNTQRNGSVQPNSKQKKSEITVGLQKI